MQGGAFAFRLGGQSGADKIEEAPHVGEAKQRSADGERDRREKPDGADDKRETQYLQHDPCCEDGADKLRFHRIIRSLRPQPPAAIRPPLDS